MIEIRYDRDMLAGIERRLGRLKSEAPKILKNAINTTAKQARQDLASEAQKTYPVKVGGFNKAMRIKNASVSNLEATISATGEHIAMKKFSVYGGKNGRNLSVLINKNNGRKSFNSNAFVNNIARKGQTRKKATSKGTAGSAVTHLAAALRMTSSRLPIKELYSVSVPQMIGNERDVYGVVEPNIMDNLHANIDKEVRKVMGS